MYQKKPCICLITGKVYECLSKYSEDTGIPFTTLSGHFLSHRFNKSPEKYKVRLIGKNNKIIWEADNYLTTTEITDDYILEDYDYELDSVKQNQMDALLRSVSEVSNYQRKMIELYFFNGLSLRQISKGTLIGLNSVHNEIKEIKEVLKHKIIKNTLSYYE